MNYPHHGTLAISLDDSIIFSSLDSFNVTSKTYDVDAIFHKLSKQIDQLDSKSSGVWEDLAKVKKEISKLPLYSEKRLECDIRIESLKWRWGITKKVSPKQKINISFPIVYNEIDSLLINNLYENYINLGKLGRKWVLLQLNESDFDEVSTEQKFYEIVDNNIKKLFDTIKEVKNSTSIVDWTISLKKLELEINELYITDLFENWYKSNNQNIVTIDQIQKWIRKKEDEFINSSNGMSTINNMIIKQITN